MLSSVAPQSDPDWHYLDAASERRCAISSGAYIEAAEREQVSESPKPQRPAAVFAPAVQGAA
jgi:hypothetical protein